MTSMTADGLNRCRFDNSTAEPFCAGRNCNDLTERITLTLRPQADRETNCTGVTSGRIGEDPAHR